MGAWPCHKHALVSVEVGDFDLRRVLNHRLVPAHYLDAAYERFLRANAVDYLKEEVFMKG